MGKYEARPEKIWEVHEFVLEYIKFVVAKAFLDNSVWYTVGTQGRYQGGKCKSGRITPEEEFVGKVR